LGVYTGSPVVLFGACTGFFLVGVLGDVNGPRFVQDPARMKEKWYGLRKAE
jgi:hypothetical protein